MVLLCCKHLSLQIPLQCCRLCAIRYSRSAHSKNNGALESYDMHGLQQLLCTGVSPGGLVNLSKAKAGRGVGLVSPQQQLEEPLGWKNVEVRDVFLLGYYVSFTSCHALWQT